ncbi:hypothetical protein CHGG_06548 [Chaetomium globosum CBS 148.51]|uniref:MYND-type zinc finger protein samB n=1 Tax=Chaetomium globosum (strain ATCC 6205 / CBS 148.51 / DSM 1962 / NBRC 6347 / NRRL 1970) TaxID=306901 RepID=Q2H467_CHAGB|nr:uncharacterized protein CHGG_06548 [Chaetomium globosum CBS 148.51]EAQ89929.1 hypothetical protein CHGG_06548 [Chaetomium globosum CBS 148.51]
MPELLLQSALAASRSKDFAVRAAQIKSDCHGQHGDHESLVSCAPCYELLLDALRARYFGSSSSTSDTGAAPDPTQEWFASRPGFLSALKPLIDSAKEYQIAPKAIDDHVQEERGRWYAERVRSSLLRLMVEDPHGRGTVFEKLQDLSTATAGGDPVALAREVADILRKGPLAPESGEDSHLPERVAAASDVAAETEVWRDAFFKTKDGTVPEDHQKYVNMLLYHRLSMEQVVDRILDERQTAMGAREQTDKLNQRLDELRRARAAHEAQKTRKAQRRESLAQQKVPGELYDLPRCAACGEEPRTEDYFTCSICTILAEAGAVPKQTVFCSERCEQQGHLSHAETHTCASALDCLQLHATTTTATHQKAQEEKEEDTPMADAPPPPAELRFCTECLTTLKQPTAWCSLACADANFQAHREAVHLPERARLGLGREAGADDEAQLEYFTPSPSSSFRGDDDEEGKRYYRARDIAALTTGLGEAVREWEERNRVKLERA